MKRLLQLLIAFFINFSPAFAEGYADVRCPIGKLLSQRKRPVFNNRSKNIMMVFCEEYEKSHAFASGVYPILLGPIRGKTIEWLDLTLSKDEASDLRKQLKILEKLSVWKSALESKAEGCTCAAFLEELKTSTMLNLEDKDWNSMDVINGLILSYGSQIALLIRAYLTKLKEVFSFSEEAGKQIEACLQVSTLAEKLKFLQNARNAGAIHDCTHTEPAIIYSHQKKFFWKDGELDPCMLSRKDACDLCRDKLKKAIEEGHFPPNIVFISESAYKGSFVDYEAKEDHVFGEMRSIRIPHICFIRIPLFKSDSGGDWEETLRFFEDGHSQFHFEDSGAS